MRVGKVNLCWAAPSAVSRKIAARLATRRSASLFSPIELPVHLLTPTVVSPRSEHLHIELLPKVRGFPNLFPLKKRPI
jgi:hypothetical protein